MSNDSNKTLYMETTSISVLKTCGEIESILMENGAKRVWKDFKNSDVESISFIMEIDGRDIPFTMPFKWQAIIEIASKGRTRYKKTAKEDQARRTAARLTLKWIQAQFALKNLGQADFEQIFLGYMLVDINKTFYDALKEKGGILALADGNKK